MSSTSDSSVYQNPDDSTDVLLIEDNPGDARLIQEAFETTDRETTFQIVPTGDEAIAFLEQNATSDLIPDLILLDLNLPGRDGCEVLELIRDDPQLQCLPVLILTSSDSEEDIVQCYKTNANAYLIKPTDPADFAELAEMIERFWFDKVRFPPVPI